MQTEVRTQSCLVQPLYWGAWALSQTESHFIFTISSRPALLTAPCLPAWVMRSPAGNGGRFSRRGWRRRQSRSWGQGGPAVAPATKLQVLILSLEAKKDVQHQGILTIIVSI